MDHFIFERGRVGVITKKNSCAAKVEKKNHAQWAKVKKSSKSFYLKDPVRPNEKLICNFCHNLISTDKNAL